MQGGGLWRWVWLRPRRGVDHQEQWRCLPAQLLVSSEPADIPACVHAFVLTSGKDAVAAVGGDVCLILARRWWGYTCSVPCGNVVGTLTLVADANGYNDNATSYQEVCSGPVGCRWRALVGCDHGCLKSAARHGVLQG